MCNNWLKVSDCKDSVCFSTPSDSYKVCPYCQVTIGKEEYTLPQPQAPLLPITKPFLPQTPIWFSKVFKGDESLGLYTYGHGDFHMEEPMLFSGRSRQFSLTFDIQYLTMTSWSNFGNWNTLNKPFPQILISAIIFFLSSADCNNTNTEVYWYCW